MSVWNTTDGWGWLARLFHWVMALMIFAMIGFGFYMSGLDDLIAKFELVQTHKSVGFTVFVLALLRIVWRLVQRRTPALPETMPRWQVMASHVSHVGLYALMLFIPLTGWLMSSASPLNDEGAYPFRVPNMVFGLFEMPDPFQSGDKDLSALFHTMHETGVKLLIALLLVHVAAALKHAIVDRDAILRRMVRGR
ncbi:cytochrome b [Oceanomicrobium pacificus]|uniref:Cytochrome b n=1 Tax=Oceanomicrobium pacificus TaxID=2692916 RepID=A0A6B0THS6_9RHOB|nr:cytochrome b [Oceanomicrobium pacificus]MXU63940.1 cytochrome b [Oceanomicrobium pacificus]